MWPFCEHVPAIKHVPPAKLQSEPLTKSFHPLLLQLWRCRCLHLSL